MWLSSIGRWLASVRLAAVLMAIVLLAGIVSFVIPQSNKPQLTLYEAWSTNNPTFARAVESVGFDDVFASPLMMAVYVLLAVNLTACTLRRLARRRRRRVVVAPPPEHASVLEIADGNQGRDTVAVALDRLPRSWTYLPSTDGDEGFRLDGGAWGFIGSMVLHAGLVLLLLGGLVSALTRFSGEMALTVGQVLPDVASSYPSAPREPVLGDGYSDGAVGLKSLQFSYEEGLITSVEGVLEFFEASGSELQRVSINAPAGWDGKSYLLYSGGHAVALTVTDDSGKVLLDGIVRLGDRTDGGYTDEVELPNGNVLRVRTISDVSDAEASDAEVMILRDPRVVVVSSTQPESIAATPLAPGDRTEADGVTVAAGPVTLWTTLLVREDGGIPVTYLAFGLIIIGTTVRLAYPDRSVAVRIDDSPGGGCIVAVWGRHRTPAEDGMVERFVADVEEGVRT